jgi:adenosylcobinamide kinase/adenosylcobinamide-phosphate guanylyltransferase
VLDCVTLWLSNVLGLHEPSDGPMLLKRERLEAERHELLAAVEQCRGNLIIVTNELGSGVVPMGELSRYFIDEHGWTNQRLAEVCDSVVLMVAGVPVAVKSPPASDSLRPAPES